MQRFLPSLLTAVVSITTCIIIGYVFFSEEVTATKIIVSLVFTAVAVDSVHEAAVTCLKQKKKR